MTNVKVGYARVSTTMQSLELQIQQLEAAGCTRIFKDTASGGNYERPGLIECLRFLRAGDELVVTRLDRLGRTVKGLIQMIEDFDKKGIKFSSLGENIDASTAYGRFFIQAAASFIELERNMTRERIKKSLDEKRKRGVIGGRPPLLNNQQFKMLKQLYDSKKVPLNELSEQFGISIKSIYRYLERYAKKDAVKNN